MVPVVIPQRNGNVSANRPLAIRHALDMPPPATGTAFTAAFHERCMREALREAGRARDAGEIPAGCIIVTLPAGPDAAAPRILGRGHNRTEHTCDPTAHAEILAIRMAAAARGDWRLTHSALYVTKEPCAMCAGAIVLARIPWVIFGAADPLRGGAGSVFPILRHPNLNHRAHILGGILETPCRELLQAFFRDRRQGRRARTDPAAHGGAGLAVPRGSNSPVRSG